MPSISLLKTVEQRSAKQAVGRSQVPVPAGTKVDVFGFIMTDRSSSLKTDCLQRGAGFNTLWAIEYCKSLLLIYGERGDISPDVKTDRMLRIGDVASPIRSIWNTKRGPPFLMEVISLEGGMPTSYCH